MENKFIKESKVVIEKLIDDWKIDHKPILSNFYGLEEGYPYEYLMSNSSVIIRKQESDFYRVYILTTDTEDIVPALIDLKGCDYIINIPSRKPIDDWDELLKKCGFEYYETYSRICNPKVATMKKRPTAIEEFAKPTDLDDIMDLLTENFSLYTAHLPSKEKMMQMIEGHQIYVDRYENGHVCGVNIFEINGPVGYGVAWLDKGEYGLDLQLNMFNHFIDHGVKRLIGWVRDSNVKVVKMHLRMGASPDGLKDYTYIKKIDK